MTDKRNKILYPIQEQMELYSELIRAFELLEKVWLDTGPYNNIISDKTMLEINQYFDFDDSE